MLWQCCFTRMYATKTFIFVVLDGECSRKSYVLFFPIFCRRADETKKLSYSALTLVLSPVTVWLPLLQTVALPIGRTEIEPNGRSFSGCTNTHSPSRAIKLPLTSDYTTRLTSSCFSTRHFAYTQYLSYEDNRALLFPSIL